MHRSPRLRGFARRGGVLTRLVLLLALVASAWFVFALQDEVEATDFSRVETSRVRLDTGAGWVDPRWQTLVAEQVARVPDFECDDASAAQRIARELSALPFVRSVAEPEVQWPDGLRIALQLRQPIACVRVGREYLTLAADGMLLSGAWPSPPPCGQGYLPLIVFDDAAASKSLRPGIVLWNDAVADALSVAASMWAELEGEDLARLGRVMIDARKARQTSVEEPGTVILLEQSRRIHFGRAPSSPEPGELPVQTKWLHTANALLCLPGGPPLAPGEPPSMRPGDVDWELVEVRWDHPAMLPRGGRPDQRVPVKSSKAAKPKPATPPESPGRDPNAAAAKTPKDAPARSGRVH